MSDFKFDPNYEDVAILKKTGYWPADKKTGHPIVPPWAAERARAWECSPCCGTVIECAMEFEIEKLKAKLYEQLRPLPWPTQQRFPIQGGFSISWEAAKRAYDHYVVLFGNSQSMEVIANRGGFGLMEFAIFYNRKNPVTDKLLNAPFDQTLREADIRVEPSPSLHNF